jgi:hypothetical protein
VARRAKHFTKAKQDDRVVVHDEKPGGVVHGALLVTQRSGWVETRCVAPDAAGVRRISPGSSAVQSSPPPIREAILPIPLPNIPLPKCPANMGGSAATEGPADAGRRPERFVSKLWVWESLPASFSLFPSVVPTSEFGFN